MAVNEGMMDFIQRYQALREHRDTAEKLVTVSPAVGRDCHLHAHY